ncbi:hypothetical protein THRCLA_08315 [Thraustotheca clavata]|uniref:Transmembrane protein n=1 Tax=Thraustotheca clavata TaxID=74557 RepID=A0A1V9Z7C0_9STRA|nr:hypothetical protein THRCLA_08315 [Thraustotheca clavata]
MARQWSTKISPSSVEVQRPSLRIDRNRIAFGVSMTMLVNIAAMPMKAYFSEHSPWSVPHQESFSNFTTFNATILREYQEIYSHERLPKFSSYFDDGANNTQVMRQVADMSTPIPSKDCTDMFLAGKPSALFYGLPIRDFLCAFAAANHSNNDTSWNYRGTCVQITYFSSDIGFQCVWTIRGNMLANVSLPNEYTVTAIHTISAPKVWCTVKFCYRMCITVFVCYLMWTRYYRHCIHLEKILSTDGHRYDYKSKPKELWHYEVVWGDPTPIILMNPYVSLVFFLDCWFSADTISIVIPRASQTDDIYIMLSAFLYLSRTVWFAYAAMCVISTCLKRFHREHVFIEIDPTIVAVATTFFGPVVSWAMGNVGFLLQIYFFLFECFIPTKYEHEQIDGGPPSMLYSISIASMPMLYGFIGGIYRTPTNQFSSSSRFSNVWYNGMKTKVMFLAMKLFQPNQPSTITQYGGSIYRLSTAIPRYNESPTISFCSSDCFIYCYYNGEEIERIRVTLLASLDRNLNSSTYAVVDAKEQSPFCFNNLQILGPSGMTAPKLLRSRHQTTWCI